MDQNHEEFDQKRFLAAMVISGLILVLWSAFFAPEPPPPELGEPSQTAAQIAEKTPDGTVPPTPSPTATDENLPVPTPKPVDLPVEVHEMRTEDLRVAFSTRGARLVEAEILQPEQYNVEGDLLGGFPETSSHFPYGLDFTKKSIALPRDLVWAFIADESQKSGEAYTKLVYRHSDPGGRFVLDKIYTAVPDAPYQLDLEVVIRHVAGGPITDNLALDVVGWKNPDEDSSFLDMLPNELEAVCSTEEDVERELFPSVDAPLTYADGKTLWGGVDNRYFLFAALPRPTGDKCIIDVIDEDFLRTRIVQPEFSVSSGQTHTTKYRLFVGPKDYDVLESVGSTLEKAVDYGIWTFLARPFRWLLVLFHGWVGNWGLAIILLTFLIRLVLWPINQKVYVNSERMKELQPKLNEIREKYADDQQRLGEETMKLWREHGVNPLGCLPMVLQFPILLALYFMILYSVELYQADFFLWYTDLSTRDPYFVLPVLMGIVMFAQQSMMTVETPNPQMATMMKVMPIMFTAFMLFLPSGVVLYYFVSLIIGLAQQFWIRRSYAAKKAQTA